MLLLFFSECLNNEVTFSEGLYLFFSPPPLPQISMFGQMEKLSDEPKHTSFGHINIDTNKYHRILCLNNCVTYLYKKNYNFVIENLWTNHYTWFWGSRLWIQSHIKIKTHHTFEVRVAAIARISISLGNFCRKATLSAQVVKHKLMYHKKYWLVGYLLI